MGNVQPWIEHLSEPLVLAGFGVFVFATIAAVVVTHHGNASANTKPVVGMLFALALFIVVGGLLLASNKSVHEQPPQAASVIEQKPGATQPKTVIQPAVPQPASAPTQNNTNNSGQQVNILDITGGTVNINQQQRSEQ